MHPLTCVKYGAAALALGPAHRVTVPRGASSEYRICVSIIISAYGTTLCLQRLKIHYCIGSLNVGVAPTVQHFSAFHYTHQFHCNSLPLEVVKDYKYLGLWISKKRNLKKAIHHISCQSKKVIFALKK